MSRLRVAEARAGRPGTARTVPPPGSGYGTPTARRACRPVNASKVWCLVRKRAIAERSTVAFRQRVDRVCGSALSSPRSRRCARMRSISSGSSMLAINCRRPPQRAHCSISIPNTRFKRRAQFSRMFFGVGCLATASRFLRSRSPCRWNDRRAQRRAGREHSVISRQVHARRRHRAARHAMKSKGSSTMCSSRLDTPSSSGSSLWV
jgi:hypothetical protein